MAKQLLIETMTVHPSKDGQLYESARGPCYVAENRAGKLIIRFPATKLDTKNENGRTYSTRVMESALKRAENDFIQRKCLGSINDHPSEPYLPPGQASHVVTGAWCEKGYMMNEAEVLETSSGKDMKALIESGVSFGVSIRGLGSVDHQGNIMEDYEYISTDGVGNPSAKIWVQPTLIDSSSSPQIHESTKQVPNMNSFDDAIKYIREQTVLMKNETDKIEAFKRAALVESTIASLSHLPAPQLVKLYGEWDVSKKSLLEDVSVAETTTEESSKLAKLREQLNTISETYRGQIGKLSEKAQQAIDKLTKALEQSEAKYKIAVEEAAKSRAKYQIALKEAALSEQKYKVAVNEAADSIISGRKVSDKLKITKQAYQEAVAIAGKLINEVADQAAAREVAIEQAAHLLIQADKVEKSVMESVQPVKNAVGLYVEQEDERVVRIVPTEKGPKRPQYNSDHKIPGLL